MTTALGSFSFPVTINESGYYDDYTLDTNIQITFSESGHTNGQIKYVLINTSGNNTLAFIKPSAYSLYSSSDFYNNTILPIRSYLFSFSFCESCDPLSPFGSIAS